jgi:hypothetical protein
LWSAWGSEPRPRSSACSGSLQQWQSVGSLGCVVRQQHKHLFGCTLLLVTVRFSVCTVFLRHEGGRNFCHIFRTETTDRKVIIKKNRCPTLVGTRS